MENSLSSKANGAEIEAETTTETSLPMPVRSFSELSRRSLLRRLGITAATVSVLGAAEGSGLTLLPGGPSSGVAWAQTSNTPPPVDGGAKQQFPYFTDSPWDQPQYYETIQAGRRQFPKTRQNADIDGDGRDEMIARGPGGIHVNRFDPDTGQWVPMPDGPPLTDAAGYDAQQFYSTIQFADINGDKRAEIIGNGPGGVFAYRYDLGTQKWLRLAGGPQWSQSNGENFSSNQYFQTIQCGDFNGDGLDELVGRNSTAIEVWRYNQESNSWTHLKDGPAWSNGAGWDQPQRYQTIQVCNIYGFPPVNKQLAALDSSTFQGWNSNSPDPQYSEWHTQPGPLTVPGGTNWSSPQYYQTIQCADIDGDGQDEVIARVASGIMVWKWKNITFNELAGIPDFKDSDGWGQPQYYQTIQTADIDGDGQDEVLGRGPDGMHVWKYETGSKTWRQMSTLTTWSDANGWDKVQHYATITSARVLKPGDNGYAGNGMHTQAVMMARGPLGMQTFRWVSDQAGWTQTSAAFPPFTKEQRAAYNYLDTRLRTRNATGEFRETYADQSFVDTGQFATWQNNLYDSNVVISSYNQSNRPPTLLTVPSGETSFTQQDLETVTWQIYWEINWLKNVYTWYGENELGSLITENAIAKLGQVGEIRNYLDIPDDDPTTLALSILALIGSMVAAILSGGATLVAEGAALGVAAAAAGFVSSTFSLVPGFLSPGGDAISSRASQLEDDLSKAFDNAVLQSNDYLSGIVGYRDSSGAYVPADYGRLRVIGQWVDDGTWAWSPALHNRLFTDAVSGYAVYVWQVLMGVKPWSVMYENDNGGAVPPQFPKGYDYYDSVHNLWLETKPFTSTYPSQDALSALFDAPKLDQITPLGVPKSDVYIGHNGWPRLPVYRAGFTTPDVPPKPTSRGVEIEQSVSLSRDPGTQNIVLTVTLENKGLTPVTNVEISDARLNMRNATAIHMPRQKRLANGHFETVTLQFPALTGKTGVLSIRGTYMGGTFGGTFRVPMP